MDECKSKVGWRVEEWKIETIEKVLEKIPIKRHESGLKNVIN